MARLWNRLRTSRLGALVYTLSRKPAVRVVAGGFAVALSFGYLGSILVRNWRELAAYHWSVDLGQVALAFGYYTIALALAVLGWTLILRRLTGAPGWVRHIRYYVYTNLLRRLPIPFLYVAGRAVLYEREGIAKSVSVTLSLLEWAVLVVAGLLVYVCTLPFQSFPSVWRSPWVLAGLLVAGVALMHPRTMRAILRLLGRDGSSRQPGAARQDSPVSFSARDILSWLLLYGLTWAAGGLVTFASIRSLVPLPVAELPSVIAAWVLSGIVTMVVLASAAGLGLKEVTLTVLLSQVIPVHLAVVVALLLRVGLTLFELVWASLALATDPRGLRKRKNHP